MTNSSGFGGTNVAAILRRWERKLVESGGAGVAMSRDGDGAAVVAFWQERRKIPLCVGCCLARGSSIVLAEPPPPGEGEQLPAQSKSVKDVLVPVPREIFETLDRFRDSNWRRVQRPDIASLAAADRTDGERASSRRGDFGRIHRGGGEGCGGGEKSGRHRASLCARARGGTGGPPAQPQHRRACGERRLARRAQGVGWRPARRATRDEGAAKRAARATRERGRMVARRRGA